MAAPPPTKSLDPRKLYPAPPVQRGDAEKGMQRGPGAERDMQFSPKYGEDTYAGHGRLAGRAALITGADSGIGRAVALAFAREGADVAIHFSGEPSEEADAGVVADAVRAAGRQAVLLPTDLVTHDACVDLVSRAAGAGLGDGPAGTIDVLVLNHATQPPAAPPGGALDAFSRADWDRIQVRGGFFFHAPRRSLSPPIPSPCPPRPSIWAPSTPCCRRRCVHMAADRGASVIVSSSVEGYFPQQSILPYAVSKAALRALVQALAPDLLATKGIRVNGVAPGPIWTPLIVRSFPGEPEQKRDTGGAGAVPHSIASHGASYPIARAGQPAEVAPAYVFLADPAAASYVAGEVLAVTGGKPTA